MTMTVKREPESDRVMNFGKAAPVGVKPVVTIEPAEPVPAPTVKLKPKLRKRKPAL